MKLVLEGWTDTTGPESYNMGLSQRRADSVKAYLEQKGIPASEMRAVGEGESTKYDNGTAEGRYLNRRVELILNKRQRVPVESPTFPAECRALSMEKRKRPISRPSASVRRTGTFQTMEAFRH